ncbi:MAG: hypothetical protein ABDH59_09580 [Fervidobacterium sp.]
MKKFDMTQFVDTVMSTLDSLESIIVESSKLLIEINTKLEKIIEWMDGEKDARNTETVGNRSEEN